MQLILRQKQARIGSVISYVFESPEALTWQAGQFMQYTLKHDQPDDKGEKRWFTIAAAPDDKSPTITTRVSESTFKQALERLEVGDAIESDAPEGDFTWHDSDLPKVFVAGGIGITPFYAMLKDRAQTGKLLDVTLVYASRNDDIAYEQELNVWQNQHPELTVHYLVGEPAKRERLLELLPELNRSLVYISGPEAMVESLGEDLKQNGLPEGQLKQDWFPGYTELNY